MISTLLTKLVPIKAASIVNVNSIVSVAPTGNVAIANASGLVSVTFPVALLPTYIKPASGVSTNSTPAASKFPSLVTVTS